MNKNGSLNFFKEKKPLMYYLLHTMRVFILLITIGLSSAFANDSKAQTKININVKEVTLETLFNEVQSKSEYLFFYRDNDIKNSYKVSLNHKNIKISKILDIVLKSTNLSYEIIKNQVVIINSNDSLNNNESITTDLQKKKITGKVTDESGQPLPGANVIEKGTANGITTDFDGNYSLEVEETSILEISYIGFKTVEVIVGNQTEINIVLLEDSESLEEVLITAQGIRKSKKALGYAITSLKSDEIEQRPEADLSRTLQGKIAGVNISSFNGETGATTDIRIRSSLSITQSNEPLIIVNNVPFGGSIRDIDANDIESMSVLKGLNASVLYGSEGRNGVIIIQTKSGGAQLGEESFKATASTTTYFNQVANLPDYQNKYGQGSEFAFVGGNLGIWGPAFDDLDQVPHPYAALGDVFPQFAGAMVPYTAKEDNVEKLFNVGTGIITSLNISSSQEKTAFNISAGYTTEEGIIGNNNLKRFNLGIGGRAQLTDELNLSATLNYSTRKANRLQSRNIFNLLLFIPRNIDLTTLPYQDPQTGASVFYRSSQNPLWIMNNTGLSDDIVRVFGTINADYKISDKINLSYRVGIDNDQQDEFDYSNRGGLGNNEFGFLDLDYDKRVTVDQTFIVGYKNDFGDHISLDAQVGINSKFLKGKSHSSSSVDQIVFGFLRPNNFRTTVADYSSYNENLAGFFGQFQFSYDNFLYVTLSGRNDWGSTVEQENRTLFYPGASVSFIPTSAFNFDSKAINYLKIRGAYATSSGYPGRFNTRNILETNPRRFVTVDGQVVVTNSVDEEFANPNLKPELHREFEVGIEGRFFNNRVRLETSVFKRISEDQILSAGLAPESGFTRTTINAGRIDTEGLEIDLGIDIIKTDNFSWNFRNLFTAYESTVVDLPFGEIELIINGTGRDRWVVEGEPFGVIKGDYALRDDQGNFLINPSNGELYISNEVGLADKIIGDPNPEWFLTTINSFSYKNFTLSAQVEYSHGGVINSKAVEDLLERGVTRDTENREGSFVLPGVFGDPVTGLPLLDTNGQPIPNDIQLNAQRTVFSNYYNADDLSTFDASVFRLREIALGYSLNRKKGQRLPFEKMTFTLSGRNLWYNAPDFPKYTNFDPENDNGIGDQTVPSTKRFAFGVAVTF